jgi:AcrR family transcriptional regulator
MTDDSAGTTTNNGHDSSAVRGRPRDLGADARILQAASELISEVGIEGTSMSAVVTRSGVARATVYRRWPSRESLIEAALSVVKGRPPFPLSGDLEMDLGRAIEQARVIYAERKFQAFLPLLVRDLLRDQAESGVSATYDSVAPNMRRIADEYKRLAESAGLRPEVDPMIVTDVIVGSLLAHLLSTGRAASRETTQQILDVLLNGVRQRDGSPTDA